MFWPSAPGLGSSIQPTRSPRGVGLDGGKHRLIDVLGSRRETSNSPNSPNSWDSITVAGLVAVQVILVEAGDRPRWAGTGVDAETTAYHENNFSVTALDFQDRPAFAAPLGFPNQTWLRRVD